MKVRCIKLLDVRGNLQDRSPWLTLGKTYHALTLALDTSNRWIIRLVGDGRNGVALFPLEQFAVVSARVSPSWIACWTSGNLFELAPERWTVEGFWEKYYDMDSEAIRVFEEEKNNIVELDP
jgi:hypothetical protein